jgi:hypothetical protein
MRKILILAIALFFTGIMTVSADPTVSNKQLKDFIKKAETTLGEPVPDNLNKWSREQLLSTSNALAKRLQESNKPQTNTPTTNDATTKTADSLKAVTTQNNINFNKAVQVHFTDDSLFARFLVEQKTDPSKAYFKEMLDSLKIKVPSSKGFYHTSKTSDGWRIYSRNPNGKTFDWVTIPDSKILGMWTNGTLYFSDNFTPLKKSKGLSTEEQSREQRLMSLINAKVDQLEKKLSQKDINLTADISDLQGRLENMPTKSYVDDQVVTGVAPVVKALRAQQLQLDSMKFLQTSNTKAVYTLSKKTSYMGIGLLLLICLAGFLVLRKISKSNSKIEAAIARKQDLPVEPQTPHHEED